MENTAHDLADCIAYWDDAESESEKKYRRKIIRMAKEIVENWGDQDEEPK